MEMQMKFNIESVQSQLAAHLLLLIYVTNSN